MIRTDVTSMNGKATVCNGHFSVSNNYPDDGSHNVDPKIWFHNKSYSIIPIKEPSASAQINIFNKKLNFSSTLSLRMVMNGHNLRS